MRLGHFFLAACVGLSASAAFADEPRVVGVDVKKLGMYWRVSVTLQHADTGWDHYADGWQILDEAGNVIGTRELMHPHVHEQPFTRSLSPVVLPDGATRIFIRARCSEDGWSKELFPVELDLVTN